MKFRSRYEGSGKARDQVSQEAESAYQQRTEKIASLERFITAETDRIMQGPATGDHLDCLFDTLLLWADQSTLLQKTDNHTGKAVRKWLLATLSSNLLKITEIAHDYTPQKYAKVKQWIASLADQVVIDYSGEHIEKINNHHYWAAWAVITAAAVLDDENLYSWAENIFILAMDQVEEGGYLPNELRRASRATLYHNYALAPLVGVAAFLRANGTDPFKYNDQALARLTSRVVHSVSTTNSFASKTGVKQIKYDLTGKGRITWVTLYMTIADLGPAELAKKCQTISESKFPLRSTRLGGDLRFIFLTKTGNNQQ
jgi:poly(beta-D-mannuronate) lyase